MAWWHHKRLAKCPRVYLSVNILWYDVNTLVFRNHTNNPDISPRKLWFLFLTKAMVCPRITSIKQLFSLTQLFKTITITDTTNPLVFLIRHSNGRSPTLANGHAWKVTGETVSTWQMIMCEKLPEKLFQTCRYVTNFLVIPNVCWIVTLFNFLFKGLLKI